MRSCGCVQNDVSKTQVEKMQKFIPSKEQEAKWHLSFRWWFQHLPQGQQERSPLMENSATISCHQKTSPPTHSFVHIQSFIQ